MKFKFVRVFESGEEQELPAEDVAEAMRLAKEEKGVFARGYLDGNNQLQPIDREQKVRVEAEGIMAIILQLSAMPKYKGARLDAIECDNPH